MSSVDPSTWDGDESQAPESARILLIEDSAHDAMLLSTLLRGAFPEHLLILHATRTADAVQELTAHGATSIVIGNPGPGEDLLGSVDALRDAAPEIPVVVVTGSEDPHFGAQAIAAGAQDYVPLRQLTADGLGRALRFAVLRKRAEAQFTRRATHDPLTGLPSRAIFLDHLSAAIDRSRRSAQTLGVLLLDIDNFKLINDSFGYATGDQLLKVVGERLRALLRPTDTVARFGGDEFALLLEDLGGERELSAMAERVGRAARVPVRLEDREASVTVSIGVAVIEDPEVDADTVMREAGTAMYRAKDRGRGRFELIEDS